MRHFYKLSLHLRVGFIVDLLKLWLSNMGVNLRRGNVFVPKHLLDIAQACTID